MTPEWGVKGSLISKLFTSWARFYGVAKGEPEHLQADDVVEITVSYSSSFAATTYTTVLIRILPRCICHQAHKIHRKNYITIYNCDDQRNGFVNLDEIV